MAKLDFTAPPLTQDTFSDAELDLICTDYSKHVFTPPSKHASTVQSNTSSLRSRGRPRLPTTVVIQGESKEEKAKRKNREHQRAYRDRQRGVTVDTDTALAYALSDDKRVNRDAIRIGALRRIVPSTITLTELQKDILLVHDLYVGIANKASQDLAAARIRLDMLWDRWDAYAVGNLAGQQADAVWAAALAGETVTTDSVIADNLHRWNSVLPLPPNDVAAEDGE